MIKKTMTYVDYNGLERTEDFYFNLSLAELTEMEMTIDGGLAEMLIRISAAKERTSIMKIFKTLILKAYGEKSLDGRRFIKSEEISSAFSQTEPYSQLYMELIVDAKASADFVNGILPTNMDADISKNLVRQNAEMHEPIVMNPGN